MLKSILVVDDDPDDLSFFVEAMADLSPDTFVHKVYNGNMAIEFMLRCDVEECPAIIFLDINMPLMNGWDCLRELKRITTAKHVPIVMFSTLNFGMQGLAPSDVGAAAFLTKPDNMTEYKSKLSQIFGMIAG